MQESLIKIVRWKLECDSSSSGVCSSTIPANVATLFAILHTILCFDKHLWILIILYIYIFSIIMI